MTWAKNYRDRGHAAVALSDSKRARVTAKGCAKCGAGIEGRKTYCAPCYDIRREENIANYKEKVKRIEMERLEAAMIEIKRRRG